MTGLLLWMALTSAAHAGISLSSTRLVFNEGRKEESLVVRNDGGEILVQSWLEPAAGVEVRDLPFVVTPPLIRVAPKQQQLLRIMYSGAGMPTDKESIFWLNVQEIPQSTDAENALQFAIRQRIKVFYRPKGLLGEPIQAATKLQWKLQRNSEAFELSVSNSGPYYVSLVDLDLEQGLQKVRLAEVQMLAPGASVILPLDKVKGSAGVVLNFGSMNDHGGRDLYSVKLLEGQVAVANAKE